MELYEININNEDDSPVTIKNAIQGRQYQSETFILPENVSPNYEIFGIQGTGLQLINGTKDGKPNTFSIVGIPANIGSYTFTLLYSIKAEGGTLAQFDREITLNVQPNVRALWRDIETPKDIEYYKEDTYCEYVKVDGDVYGRPRKDMVAASRRGRSHAKEGRPRDDHFRLEYCEDSGWYIMAVADGAGSSKYSRRGSKIACDTVVDCCLGVLRDDRDIEEKIRAFHEALSSPADAELARKIIGDTVYRILGNAAYRAHKRINEEAAGRTDALAKDFATTLLLSVCKQYDFGWFIATFWVGDGAICLYDAHGHTATLLGVPDEGEFSGQTRFLTMSEIFSDTSTLYRRLRLEIKEDFTALMLMSDGVSDPMFGTDASLKDVNKWDELWYNLQRGFPEDDIQGVNLTGGESAKEELLQWLNFWAIGEHDDRTIAILF